MTVPSPGRLAWGHRARPIVVAAVALTAAALVQDVWARRPGAHVTMKDVAYAPAQITTKLGETVTWDNADIVAHTATSKEGGFDVEVSAGGRVSAVMTRPGTFSYICRYHPTMKGRVVVEP